MGCMSSKVSDNETVMTSTATSITNSSVMPSNDNVITIKKKNNLDLDLDSARMDCIPSKFNDDEIMMTSTATSIPTLSVIPSNDNVTIKKKNNLDLDLDSAIFENISSTSPTTKCNSYSSCLAVHRLISLMKEFTKLENQHVLVDFMENVYSIQIHDDMYHLMKYHQNDLEDIYQNLILNKYQLQKCNFRDCINSDRHYRVIKTNKNNKWKHLSLYIETMDSLHFLLYHLYDSSLRIKSGLNFSQILDEMSSTRTVTNRFGRLTTNKFNISADIERKDAVDDHDGHDKDVCDTFLDSIYNSLLPKDLVDSLKQIVSDQEYDTESLEQDMELFKIDKKSNISQQINNDTFINQIVDVFNAAKGIFMLLFFYFFFIHFFYILLFFLCSYFLRYFGCF